MREVLALVAIGIVSALPAAWISSRLVRSQLCGVTPDDAVGMVVAAGVLAIVAAVAAFVPARRATAISPMQALRSE
jgi:ABC-type antimicrobial peptide transport system permease subunit